MEYIDLPLLGAKLLRPIVYRDDRGYFYEKYKKSLLRDVGIDCEFVQDNCSYSKQGTLRGMHFQSEPGQSKLICVMVGSIYDVFVDIRKESPTFGKWDFVVLDGEKNEVLFLPVGFAHGFYVLSEEGAYVTYKVSNEYSSKYEKTFCYNDPEIRIQWPGAPTFISSRDSGAGSFKEVCL